MSAKTDPYRDTLNAKFSELSTYDLCKLLNNSLIIKKNLDISWTHVLTYTRRILTEKNHDLGEKKRELTEEFVLIQKQLTEKSLKAIQAELSTRKGVAKMLYQIKKEKALDDKRTTKFDKKYS